MSVNVRKVKQGKTERYTFGHTEELVKVPPLLEIQKKSYKDFLEKGIKRVLDEFFPLTDYSGKAKLESLSFSWYQSQCKSKTRAQYLQ